MTQPCGQTHSFRMWNRLVFICFCRSHIYFKDAKTMQINRILKWSLIGPGGLSSISPKNNRDLTQNVCIFLFKLGDPSFNGRWVIMQTSKVDTDTHTDTDSDNTRSPKGLEYKWNDLTLAFQLPIYIHSLIIDNFKPDSYEACLYEAYLIDYFIVELKSIMGHLFLWYVSSSSTVMFDSAVDSSVKLEPHKVQGGYIYNSYNVINKIRKTLSHMENK